jgi:predicted nucleotidyltransferase
VYNKSKTISFNVISSMTEQIVRQFQPKQVILFGSMAHGEGHANSDVDLLVVFPEVADKRKAAIEIRRNQGFIFTFGVEREQSSLTLQN